MPQTRRAPVKLCSTLDCKGNARVGGVCKECYDRARRQAKALAKKLAAKAPAYPVEEHTPV